MINSDLFFKKVLDFDKKLGGLSANLDSSGAATIIPSSVTLDVIVIQTKGLLVPIEIRKDKDNLGWLYDPKDRYVIVDKLGVCKLKDLVKLVEDGVKANKREASDFPMEFKITKKDGSILTFININTLSKILC